MKSKIWLNRQKKDYFVKKANLKGYLSRSAYKLIEIDQKYKIINQSKNIFEFGASPGGWTQVSLEINPQIEITAIDLLDLKFDHPNITFIKEDYLNFNFNKLYKKFDLVLSDIAPNTIGHQSTDHLRISAQVIDLINLLELILLKDGSFIAKIWKGSEEIKIINILKKMFEKVSYFKPKSSRKDSSEIYIVAIKYLN